MEDIRTRREIKRGWWLEERSRVPLALPNDGLIFVVRRQDAEEIFDKNYPHKRSGDNKVWFFNNSFDREIAEIDPEGRISANPQALVHFLEK